MVAAGIAHNFGLAEGARPNFVLEPERLGKDSLHLCITAEARVVHVPAADADLRAAQLALDHFDFAVGSDHRALTVRLRTVPQKEI